jgi:L-amino acid N-acyltransferase YncA
MSKSTQSKLTPLQPSEWESYNHGMDPSVLLASLTSAHWDRVRSIYLQGIATGNATFQQAAPDWNDWDKGHLRVCRVVAKIEDEVAGWAALSPVSPRPVYSGVAEVSVYVAEAARRRGVGIKLISQLIANSEAEGIWTLQAGIFPENVASIGLHTKAGFRIVGTRERLGRMNGLWRDVVLMERRSSVAGS